MTLLVAGVVGKNIWMVADTAITGGSVEVRDREYLLKVIPSSDGRALLGFAGGAEHGSRFVEEAARMPAGNDAVGFLLKSHCENRSVDFAYGFVDDNGPHLFRVSKSEAVEVPTLHIGLDDAFEHFQRIRHDAEIVAVPEAVSIFFTGSRATDPVPPNADRTITSMLRLFAERSERDVGGWPVAYHLTNEGAFLCGYIYSVSDPVLKRIGPGSIVAHGSAESGGFGLSVTELGVGKGVVTYWRQQPGGLVFRRTDGGYEVLKFDGIPALFNELASAATEQRVEVLFSDQPAGPPEGVTIMRDEQGLPCMAMVRHGGTLSFSVLNVGTAFRSRGAVNLQGTDEDKPGGLLASDRLTVELNDDKSAVTIDLLTGGKPATEIELQANELDAIIAALGEARATMRDKVSVDAPDVRGTREVMVLDPAWRTNPQLHPSLAGITLRLRHTGFGWLTFLLPHHEARSLGEWLFKNSQP
jgi:hypothetical protein